MPGSIQHIAVKKSVGGELTDATDELAVEEPLEITLLYSVDGKPEKKIVSVTMRTPGNDEELAAGFLFTEGIISSYEAITAVYEAQADSNKIMVALKSPLHPNLGSLERNFYTTSSCGVCGKTSIDAIKTIPAFAAASGNMQWSPELIHALPGLLRRRQDIFERTGGLHASALFDAAGNLLLVREDVGRHNALDKLIGAAMEQRMLPLNNHVLLLSGRGSFELIQKAAMAGIQLVAAVGAPSSLAVQMAQEAGITLIGFLRGERFTIYTGAQRIKTNSL